MAKLNNMYGVFKESIVLQGKIMANIFLLSSHFDSIEIIKDDLKKEVNPLTLHLIKQLPENMKVSLLPDVLEIMRHMDGKTRFCQDIILTMDREWLKNNIWTYSEHILDDQDYETIGIFMYLFNNIDRSLSEALAVFALNSADEDVREIGEIYFEKNEK